MKINWLVPIMILITTLVACSDPVKALPKIISFTATPSTLTAAGDVKLEWVVENATELSVSPSVGVVQGTFTTFKITSSKTFTLTAKNQDGIDTKSLEVKLDVPNLPVSTVQIDTTLKPVTNTVPSLEDGQPRSVATLTDKSGIKTDFVENEILITSNDQKAVNEFLSRWGGTEIKILTPPQGLETKPIHLVRINAAAADLSKLPEDLKALDATNRADLKISSLEGEKLLAVMAREAQNGLQIGLNLVGQDNSIPSGAVNEAPRGIFVDVVNNQQTLAGYTSEVFNWTHFASNNASNQFPQDFGVADAWRLMSLAGRLKRNIPVAVIDGGFSLDGDIPVSVDGISQVPFDAPFNSTNPSTCTGGAPCPWHGTDVLKVLAATPDNNQGTAGTAGPVVSRILTIHGNGDIVTSTSALWEAFGWGAKIVNMSFGTRVPASLSWSVLPFNATTLALRNAGMLIFAAAGNAGENVDEEDCFGIKPFRGCWEAAWHTPCENGGVICVGGLNSNAVTRATRSNYGAKDVDIFGPYVVYAGSNPSLPNNQAVSINGTSGTSPFIAGIAALIWSVNPGFSADNVERILMQTSHVGSPDGTVNRWANAFEAIKLALGGAEFFKDRFEINDTEATATPLTPGFYDSLSLHNSSDRDFYKFDFAAEKSLVDFDFRYIDRLGNLNSAYLSPSKTNCGLPRLKKIVSSTLNNQRTLQYEVAQGSQTLQVGAANQNVYTMNVGVTGLPVIFTPDEFDTPIRNDLQNYRSSLGFRDYYGQIEANFDNGQDVDWYSIHSFGTDPDVKTGKTFYFDIGSSDVPVTVEVYAAGSHTKLFQESSSTTCTKLPHIPLPDGNYDVKVSSAEYQRGNYVFGAVLQDNYFKLPQIIALRDYKPRPTLRDIQYFELLGQSDGFVFSPPPSLEGIQILGQGFHVQLLDLTGKVLQEGLEMSNLKTRSSTRADTNSSGEQLSFSGLSPTTKYVLGVFRTDIPEGLTEEEISRLPIIEYKLSVISNLAPDQTLPVAKVAANTSVVLYPQTVTITADAKDDVGLDGVLFYEDGQLVNIDGEAPYTLELTYSMLRNGSHTYSAKVIDTSGNVSDSLNQATVGVDISNMIQNPGAELSFGLNTESPPVEAIAAFAPKDGFTVIQYGSPNGFPGLDLAAQIAGETNFFAGGTASVSSAEQLLNVFDGADQIDTGTLVYELSGLLGGYANQEDHAEVILTFRDGFGFDLGTAKLEPVSATMRQGQTNLLARQVTGTLPIGTRIIIVKMIMTKADAADTRNDGYADNLALRLHKP